MSAAINYPPRNLPAGRVGALASGAPMAVLDIGTSKICCMIASARSGEGFSLIGRGFQSADGLLCGEVVDLEAAESSIRAVLAEAEEQAGESIREAVVVTGAGRPRSRLMRVERGLDGRTVAEKDIRSCLDRARQEVAEAGLTALHLVPIEVSVDGGRPLKDARGIPGSRLEALIHVVAADPQPLRDLLRCLERCHISVRGVVAAAFASGMGCLTEDEIERGVLVIDIGAGATHVAHFTGGKLVHVDMVPKGGERITADVAIGLETSRREAEKIKNLYGGVLWRACDDNVRIEVARLGDRVDQPTGEVPRTRLTWIIRARVEEILEDVMLRLRDAGDVLRAKPPRGIVITGGAAQIEGIDELAEEKFGLPARLGRPRSVFGPRGHEEDPACVAAAGALALAAAGRAPASWDELAERRRMSETWGRVRTWFRQNF